MELDITTSPSPERYVVLVSGEIDISNADRVRDAINLALEQPTAQVVLDFTEVSYIDSTGIGVLVGAAHHAAERKKGFCVEGAQPNVVRVAQLLGVDREINIS